MPHWFPHKMTPDERAQKFHTCLYPDLGSASDWSCCMGNFLQPIKRTTQNWVVIYRQYCRETVFLCLLLRRHIRGKPMVALQNVGRFLSLDY